jgi:hypothetical protein
MKTLSQLSYFASGYIAIYAVFVPDRVEQLLFLILAILLFCMPTVMESDE